MVESLSYCRTDSPVGPLFLGFSQRGLMALEFDRPGRQLSPKFNWVESRDRAGACLGELEAYFAGRRREFSIALDLRGTEFQLRCWQALLAIPYGQTRTYAEIAQAVRCPRGFRAVGMANHDRPSRHHRSLPPGNCFRRDAGRLRRRSRKQTLVAGAGRGSGTGATNRITIRFLFAVHCAVGYTASNKKFPAVAH